MLTMIEMPGHAASRPGSCWRRAFGMGLVTVITAGVLLAGIGTFSSADAQQQPPQENPAVRPPSNAVKGGAPGAPGGGTAAQPGADRASNYDIEMWKKLRGGASGQVSIPDKKAGVLVQSEGEAWRNLRNGPLPTYGSWALGGTLAMIALFFLVRGRIRIEHGWAGHSLLRFTTFERMTHWLLAVSFIILGLTGLNILYGRYVLLPVIGKEAFAAVTSLGKLAHNYVAFAFMVALVLAFVRWIIHNFPSWRDVVWLARAGGMIGRSNHPPSWKFNAGQKILFWLVMLGGISLSLSGLSMMMPEQMPLFAKTFAVSNKIFGTALPTTLTAHQEMQYAVTWHGIMALLLTCVIIGHIYIGTLGMQGAFSAMGSGQVDVNWAREHHSLWAERELSKMNAAAGATINGQRPAPAE